MRKTLTVALLCAVLPASALADPSPAPNSTPLPVIYHSYSSPLCSALRTRVKPAIAMILQNDATIAKSNPLFKRYVSDSIGGGELNKPSQDMTVVRLSNLVRPLVDNILATQKLLEDSSVFPDNPQTDDEKRRADLKAKALAALAAQQASLDIINGFVQTQELAGMQHDGFGYIGAITGTDMTSAQRSSPASAGSAATTPDPFNRPSMFDDTAINAGLAANPYEYNLPSIPGLALGYNPVSRLKEGVEWTQSEGSKNEDKLSKSVMETNSLCGGDQPSASPKP